MTGPANNRRIALALVVSITLMTAIVPFCQVVACHDMVGSMSTPMTTTFAAECAAPISSLLSPGILAENALTTMLTLVATFFVALMLGVPPLSTRVARISVRETSPPLEHPRGIRLIA